MELNEAQVGIITALITAIAAIAAFLQYRKTLQVNTVLHFTKEYFSLVQEIGKEPEDFTENNEWAKYWSLHSTEFYFYKNNAIPPKMYALWIIEVAELYREKPKAWESHEKFLCTYKHLYPEMVTFFTKVRKISSKEDKDIVWRHKEIAKLIIPYEISWADGGN